MLRISGIPKGVREDSGKTMGLFSFLLIRALSLSLIATNCSRCTSWSAEMAAAALVPDNTIHRGKDFRVSPPTSAIEQQGENQSPKPLGVQKLSHNSGQKPQSRGNCVPHSEGTFAQWSMQPSCPEGHSGSSFFVRWPCCLD